MTKPNSPKLVPDTLYYGDCLEIARDWPDGVIDLVYLDPPFNSQQKYSCLFTTKNGITAQMNAYNDMWKWDAKAIERVGRMVKAEGRPSSRVIRGVREILGECGMLSYLSYMAERLELLHRLLKPTGSLLLHCDPTANSYLRLLLDAVFGIKHQVNELVWFYDDSPGGRKASWFPKKHDTIYYYAKRKGEHTFNGNAVKVPIKDASKRRYDSPRSIGGKTYEGGDTSGKVPESVWPLPVVKKHPGSKESTGYDTEKPMRLLERIVLACSNEGDLVMDPFCGSGPSVAAADKYKRRWVGVDLQPYVLEICRRARLKREVSMVGMPKDLSSARVLHADDPFKFEAWAIVQIDGLLPNQRQRGDGGVDGRGRSLAVDSEGRDLVLAQVKGGKYKADDMKAFRHVMDEQGAAFGVFITMDHTPAAVKAAARAGSTKVGATKHQRVTVWSIQGMFEGVRPPLPDLVDPHTGEDVTPQARMFP